MNFKQIFQKFDFFIPLILLVSVILFSQSYEAGTYLTGWDNLHPEFNFWLNLKRSLFGVWQDYRGLGLYDGQAHTANIVHTLTAYVFNLFMPTSLVRYVMMAVLHAVGMLGMYFFTKNITKYRPAAALAALFYGLNIGVIQQFYAPFEVFIYHFAFLPWLWHFTYRYIQDKKASNALWFFVISLLATPAGFVPTVFVATSLAFLMFVPIDIAKNKSIKAVALIGILYIIANSFWLFPFAKGVVENASVIESSRINEYSSDVAYVRNQQRGDIVNALQMKGFMLDVTELDGEELENITLMESWKDYASSPFYTIGFTLLFAAMGYGVYKLSKDTYHRYFILSGLIALFFLANNTVIIREVNGIIRTILPAFDEAFRFPFTKFIILLAAAYALFLAYGISKIKNYRHYAVIIGFVAILMMSFPAFRGNIYSPLLKQEIPNEYFETFQFFESQDENARIALLPAHSYWSWQHRRWGYVGSDFLWFGIKQPIMSRAFDPWSTYNEQFYNELSYALVQNDVALFSNVLTKYRISYLLIDQSLINDIGSEPIDYDKMADFLESTNAVENVFTEGVISVYALTNEPQLTASTYQNMPRVGAMPIIKYVDTAYADLGDYASGGDEADYIYPFPAFFSEKLQKDMLVTAELDDENIYIYPKYSPFQNVASEQIYTLEFPSYLTEPLIPVEISITDDVITATVQYPTFVVDGQRYEISGEQFQEDIPVLTNETTTFELTESDQTFKDGDIVYLLRDYPNTTKITTGNSVEYITFDISTQDPATLGINLSITPESEIGVVVPAIYSQFAVPNAIANKGYSIVGPEESVTITDNGLEIAATTEAVDIVVFNGNMIHENGYIVFANTDYEKGVAMTFYVDTDQLPKAFIESRLPTEKESMNTLFMPPSSKIGSGYSFHFVSTPVDRQIAEYNLNELSVYPFPFTMLKELKLVSQSVNEPDINRTDIQMTKYHSFLYSIPAQNTQNSTLLFPIAYNAGWDLYEVPNMDFMNTYVPFLQGKKVSNKLIMNNWANGWKISDVNPDAQLIFIFCPQYIEFAGFGLIGITSIGLLGWLLLTQLKRKSH